MSRVLWVFLAVALVSCGGTAVPERAAVVTFTGCGDAFGGEVAAIVVGPDRAVTVAHAVAQAAAVEVEWAGTTYPGRVVAYDGRSDLAIVHAAGLDAVPVEFGVPMTGTDVRMIGGLASADLPLAVTDTPIVRIEEVLGTDRVERAGVKLAGDAAVGDSGAGLFDADDALVGVVFAVSDDGSGEVWATASSEIAALLTGGDGEWQCDATESRLVAIDQG